MDPLLDFSNKVVVITGAAQGFGQLLAESLALRGAKLVLGDINEAGAKQVAETIHAAGGEIVAMGCDVSQSQDCRAMVEMAVKRFGRLDIAVNNAGIAHEFTPLHEIDVNMMERQFAVNVKGVQFGMKYQIGQMLKQGEGCILNVSSMAGLGGAAGLAAYSAAKHAVIGLTKSGAVEYAEHNIRINAVCPFFTLTPMVTDVTDESAQKAMGKASPIRRLAEPQEVVNTMIMLLSPANTYLVGQCIAVDGGVSAR